MRLSKFSDVLGNWIVNVIPACRKAGEAEGVLLRVRTAILDAAVQEATLPSAKQRRPRELNSSSVFLNSEFLPTLVITCVISNAVFGALFKLLAPSKNLHRGGHVPRPPC